MLGLLAVMWLYPLFNFTFSFTKVLGPYLSFQFLYGLMCVCDLTNINVSFKCWIGSLGCGPNNVLLEGKFASTSTYQFQDEIGEIIGRICSFVPHGILCFVPSYMLLEKLCDRFVII